jgi:hypothetical protein
MPTKRRVRSANASAKTASESAEMSATRAAREIWLSLVVALRQAGYEDAGPEYIRLSRLLQQNCTADLMTGRTSSIVAWDELRQIAAEAVSLLGPMVTAASMLADLPTGVDLAPDAPAAKPEPTATSAKNGPPRKTRKPAKKKAGSPAGKSSRTASTTRTPTKKSTRGGTKKKSAAGPAKRKAKAKKSAQPPK